MSLAEGQPYRRVVPRPARLRPAILTLLLTGSGCFDAGPAPLGPDDGSSSGEASTSTASTSTSTSTSTEGSTHGSSGTRGDTTEDPSASSTTGLAETGTLESSTGEGSGSSSAGSSSSTGGDDSSSSTTGPALPQPLAVFHFDGDLLDASGNGYDAAAFGDVVFVPAPEGLAVRCASEDAYVDADALGEEMLMHLDGFTMFTRVRIDGVGRIWGHITVGETPETNGTWLIVEDGALRFGTEIGNGVNQVVALGPPPKGWADVVIVVDGTTVAYYLDGVLQISTEYTPAETTNTQLAFCGYDLPGSPLEGAIDELRFFDVPLAADEVAGLP